MQEKRWDIFLASVFFVLGFSFVFSLLGVLLQSILANVSYTVQTWIGRIGGTIIIIFGIYLLDLIHLPFLEQEHKAHIGIRTRSTYLTSFLFGAAFGAGWTPCVGPVLGAILSLAATQPSSAFLLLLAYSLGLGIPFLLVGLFTNQAKEAISKAGKWLMYVRYFFGVILIGLGILVFTSQLSRVANFEFLSNILIALNLQGITASSSLNIGISFLAGIISFLSPCVLPLIPSYLAYLASTVTKQ